MSLRFSVRSIMIVYYVFSITVSLALGEMKCVEKLLIFRMCIILCMVSVENEMTKNNWGILTIKDLTGIIDTVGVIFNHRVRYLQSQYMTGVRRFYLPLTL